MKKLIFGFLNYYVEHVDTPLTRMVKFFRAANSYLDNCIGVRKAKTKEDLPMAKHRLRVCVGYNSDGSEVVKRICAGSELELADQAAKTLLNSERRKEFVKESGDSLEEKHAPTFKDYVEEWISVYKVQKLRKTTLESYRYIVSSHLLPEFGNMRLDEINTKRIQEMLNNRKDLSKRTLSYIMTLLRAILQSASKDGIISGNPADDDRLVIPSSKVTPRKALTLNEVRDIIESMDKLENEDDRRFIGLLLYTGMRRGEVMGLRWEDIDFENGEIHVRRNVTFPNGCNQPCIGEPKSASGVRDIPITSALVKLLYPPKPSGFVIGGNDTPGTMSSIRRRMERLNSKIDLHGATPHVFRHSYATLLNDVGADVKTIQSIIGDSDFKTVADRYCHARDDRKVKAAKAVDKLLG